MGDCHRLVQMMREAGKTPQNEIVDIVMGQVTSVSPLKVKIESRELSETFLVLSALCKETRRKGSLSISCPDTNSVNYDILLWRGLKVGDRVLMLKVSRGQKYFVLQRVEGVN